MEKRLQACIDLVAAEAVYHDMCLTKFMLKRDQDSLKKTKGQYNNRESFTFYT